MTDSDGLVFERDYHVRFHDCDPDLRLSVAACLRYFEEIALLQSEALGVGFDYYHDSNVTWVLSRWDVRFRSRPRFRDRVTVLTQPQWYRSFTADRRFEVNGADGTRHVDAFSRWIFLDTERMRPRRIHEEIARVYAMAESAEPIPWEGEAVEPRDGVAGAEFTVGPGDIDMNGHLNNIRYVEWALFGVPEEIRASRPLERLLVHFRKETRLGAKVRTMTEVLDTGDTAVVRQAVGEADRAAAVVETRWGR